MKSENERLCDRCELAYSAIIALTSVACSLWITKAIATRDDSRLAGGAGGPDAAKSAVRRVACRLLYADAASMCLSRFFDDPTFVDRLRTATTEPAEVAGVCVELSYFEAAARLLVEVFDVWNDSDSLNGNYEPTLEGLNDAGHLPTAVEEFVEESSAGVIEQYAGFLIHNPDSDLCRFLEFAPEGPSIVLGRLAVGIAKECQVAIGELPRFVRSVKAPPSRQPKSDKVRRAIELFSGGADTNAVCDVLAGLSAENARQIRSRYAHLINS